MRFFGFIHKKYLWYLVVFVVALSFFSFFVGRGLMQIYQLREEREKIKRVNVRLQGENRKLAEQVERMHHKNREEVEKIVREELGLVKKGEMVYQFE